MVLTRSSALPARVEPQKAYGESSGENFEAVYQAIQQVNERISGSAKAGRLWVCASSHSR